MPKKRFFRRILLFLFFLITFDILLRIKYPEEKVYYQKYYRLKKNAEPEDFLNYIQYVELQKKKNPQKIIIVFLGSSPTYGHKIKKSQNTYPYAFAKNLNHKKIQVYNFATDGQLLSDEYYLLKKLINTADIFFVQLNYHTFNPLSRDKKMFYDELPDVLGVKINFAEAKILGRRPTPLVNLNFYLQDYLKKIWFFYKKRKSIAKHVLGINPKTFLFNLKNKKKSFKENNQILDNVFIPFFELPLAKQILIIKRYAKYSKFKIKKNNSEIIFLNKILNLLKQNNKKAVFFISPINFEAIDYYELFTLKEYLKNLKIISKPIIKAHYLFLDLNKNKKMPAQYFFDISHTLDAGGKLGGKILYLKTKNYLKIN